VALAYSGMLMVIGYYDDDQGGFVGLRKCLVLLMERRQWSLTSGCADTGSERELIYKGTVVAGIEYRPGDGTRSSWIQGPRCSGIRRRCEWDAVSHIPGILMMVQSEFIQGEFSVGESGERVTKSGQATGYGKRLCRTWPC
jgi:hypothetical protein